MADKIRVVHYLNQFFGGIGGEEAANTPVEVREEPVGPGRAVERALGDAGSVVATIIAGDNYIVEESEAALRSVGDVVRRYAPDVVLAGPAFEAGRYGLACAEVCKEAQNQGVAAVTGMYPDNPGVIAHRGDIICVPTGTIASEMPAVLSRMVALALKLGRGEQLGTAAEEGYLPRGLRRPIIREKAGAARAADMLKARLDDEPYLSEVFLKKYDVVTPPGPLGDPKDATFALITTGAVVPKGNPDKMPAAFATRHYRYSIEGMSELGAGEWESVHGGFNTVFLNTRNPNYALPLPAVRTLESQGAIKAVLPYFFSTPGVATAVNDSTRIGSQIAQELKEAAVDAALLVAT